VANRTCLRHRHDKACSRPLVVVRILSNCCLVSVIKHSHWYHAVEKWVLLFKASYPVPSTLLNTYNMGTVNVKHCSVTARSKTFPKDRPLYRKYNSERPMSLVFSKTLQHTMERKLLCFPCLVDACTPVRKKYSCPAWREKNVGPQSWLVIREALHQFRRFFTLTQLSDLVPE